MREFIAFLHRLLNLGPWYVVGEYLDDEGNLRRFRCGNPHVFPNYYTAAGYAAARNGFAETDPLGTKYSACSVRLFQKL